MPKKHALLIANTEYRDGKLSSMPHPGLAYAELADALKDPSRGAFSQVETLVNSNLSHVLNTLDRFFTRKPADDILLVYVGAHGFVDAQGELFLALKESDRFRLKSTALMAAVLGTNMDQCPSPHKLIILDGRFHSPYQDGRGGSASAKVDPAKVFAGRGMPKLILSASEQPAAAPPGNPAAPSATSSTQKIQIVAPKDFTRALAETLRTPTTRNGGRNAFTVEDWWNDAVAELKASKAEPPTRHAVGDPPLTVLRGASLPRPELALSASSESKVMMPAMPQEPEADWSRLSGIFPLEMFAPDMAAQAPSRAPSVGPLPADGADETLEEPPTARTLQMDTRELESRRGDETIIAGPNFIEGADLVLRAREAIEKPEAGPLEGTLEIPVSDPALAEKPAHKGADIPYALDTPGTPADAGTVRRPDATLFYDLRLPPDLAGNATFIWDRPKVEGTREKPAEAAPKAHAPGPRDTFTDLRARLKAQEEEEKEARLKDDREEAAQREKLDQWKARWDARLSGRPVPAPGRPDGKPEAAPADAASAEKPKLSKYQSKMMALQKTVFVPGPDTDPNAETQAQPVQQEPATPPIRDGLATVVVSKDQFLNTGTHKALTELTPGATIRVAKEEFYRTESPSTGSPEAAPGEDQGSGTLVAERPEGRGPRDGGRDRDARRTGGQPRIPRRGGPAGSSGENGGFRKIALWALAAMLPVGLALFLFFGYRAGLFAAFGVGGAAPRTEAPRIPQVTPPPAPEPVPAPPVEEDLPVETAEAEPAVAPVQTKPSAPPVSLAPAVTAPAPQPKPAPASPAAVRPAAPPAPAARPAVDPAALQARLQADSLRRAEEKALRDAQKAAKFTRDSLAVVLDLARKDSVKAARKTRDSLAVVRDLARKDSLRTARRTQDSLLTARAQAKQDSIVQARLIRDYERAKKAEADAALHAIERARQDSLKAIQESAQSEALLRKSVNQAMRADTQELRGLYNRFALGYPGLKGEVVVNILVAPTGEIEKGTVHSSSTGVKMFDQLVLGNVLEWKIRPFKAREAKAILVGLRFPPE